MQISFITPTSHIKEFGSQSDFILALSHLINHSEMSNAAMPTNPEYEKEIIATGLPILLDNGLFENGIPELIDSLIDKAIKIKAFGFFAPDYLYNSEKTKEQLYRAFDKMIEKELVSGYRNIFDKKMMLGAVVQGSTKEEWLKQYVDFCNMDEVDIVGWSILSIPKCFSGSITEARIECMKEVLKLDVKQKRGHLLGIGESYADVLFAKQNCPFIQSNDSSCAFQSGLFGKRLTNNLEVPEGKVKEKVQFDLKNITEEQRQNIQHNINLIKSKCQ